MCADKKPTPASGRSPFEAELARLEKLVESLESGTVSLDELVTKYEEGSACSSPARKASRRPSQHRAAGQARRRRQG
jgi:exodeoxyribonuclease VII small subunit